MDAPPEKENSVPFVAISDLLLDKAKINVPEVFHKNFDLGFFVISDLGNEQYLTALNKNSYIDLYRAAIHTLIDIQRISTKQLLNIPDYNQKLLLSEMDLFRDWYLERHLVFKLSSLQENLIIDTFNFLSDIALTQHQVLVHRDYHSRNLMTNADSPDKPGVLDFQDAVIGPFTYDLVSLLRDCYINWPESEVINLALYYKKIAIDKNIIPEIDDDNFIKFFDLMGIQRHLKAIGIFSRLNYRDNKAAYLGDIPRTLFYVQNISKKYIELDEFNHFITNNGK
jgi:aminoglycoside/choline kinase family phosphotransferase